MERDYYALLGVSRGASSDEIRGRFLSLSREFHPDRRRGNAALVAAANAQYAVLDRAYKVLCDPVTRRVYDIYGETGVHALEQDGAARQQVVGAHLKTAEEMEHYVEQIMRRMNQQALEAQFSSFSEMSMHVDASDFVQAPMQGMRSLFHSGARFVDRTEMTIHQRTAFPLSRNTTLTLGGYMYDKMGMGMGSFTAQLQHTSFDPSIPSFTLMSELGWTPKLHCQISQPVSPHTVFMLIPELDDNGLDISMGANQLLSPQLHGAMMWSTRDGLSGSLSQDTGTYNATAAVAVNGAGPNVTFQFRRVLMAATTAKLSLRAGLASGMSLVAGASREISNRTRVALGVLLARTGVTLRLGFTRGSVRFVMPIFLSPFSAQSAFSTFCAATSPFVVAAVVTQLVKPAQERKRRLELEHRHDLRVQYLASARQGALEQQKLMSRCAKEKVEQEQQREDGKGLVVLLARYGKNPTSPDSREARGDDLDVALQAMRERDLNREAGDEVETGSGDSITQQEADAELLEQKWVDVTTPLQFFVKDGELALTSSSKAGLLGFYNPCIGEDQTIADARSPSSSAVKPLLYVRYAYDGQVFEATFDDDQVVSLPSRYAQVMGPAGSVY
ncbi:DnaJ (Hsp40), sub C, member 11 [Phytophthora pseudosyringae]|uniref:DnaJ (Hsp40), sub C, member 11 n=1 Tax=Phytophthora pseudosyringae TaxID=221518 RepID=A0A8T1VB72_9STRA|nr:DnaJ (Hsp40), sub C, member 11 [Phytophthora pseudosyringae]